MLTVCSIQDSTPQRRLDTKTHDLEQRLGMSVFLLRRGPTDLSPHLFTVSNYKVFTMSLLGKLLGVFWHDPIDFELNTMHNYVMTNEQHSGTRRCTFHPHTQTTTTTQNTTKHVNSVHIWISCPWMRSVDSLLANKGMGRGSSWSLDLETPESDDEVDSAIAR